MKPLRMATKYGLPATGRLKHRKLIDALFTGGQKLSAGPYRVYFSVQPASPDRPAGVLFGTGVSKKKFARAVDRNLVKRRCREAYRLQQNSLHQLVRDNNRQVLLFFIYTGNSHLSFEDVYRAVGQALEKIGKKISGPRPGTAENPLNK